MATDNKLHAIILGGGFGTRLSGTVTVPKGLISTGGTTLVGKVITDLLRLPLIKQISLITNAKYFPAYQQYLQSQFPDTPIKLLNDGATTNDTRLGALGDLIYALDQTQAWDTDTLVLPTDTYYSFPLQEFIDFYSQFHSFTTVVREMSVDQIANRLGCAVMDGDRITAFIEKPPKPPSPYAAIPFYIYPQPVLSLIHQYQSSGGSLDSPGSIIPWLLAKSVHLHAFKISSETIDVGTHLDLEHLQHLSLS